ncbi:hypothetical protein [Clostridium botulinum]|uniref:hypothetical protein n=1 Tax=Clostridium botulinum TaxID=1491 RepID=UPI0002075008|nr:hypothetical protein [Clostridium botulinum]AEB77660.1 hypothetical protein CbC4_7049 [Clostridium botulinum BKT015925]KLU74219.1 hypothetical protein CBC3_p0363 [Clostridium botulinum V891]MCD3211024.1 hypothetical protein [Clostridium botulinum C/D]MCD3211077.1 hypothetical protein [Clostridium botulinum C/D]MCD3259843.1 hypothetical protein [Clostridium botulinum C/D]
MEKAKVKLVKDSRNKEVAIFNGKFYIGNIEINELVDFLKDGSMDIKELNKR